MQNGGVAENATDPRRPKLAVSNYGATLLRGTRWKQDGSVGSPPRALQSRTRTGGGNGAKPYAPSFFTAQMEDFLKDVATDYGQDPVTDPTY
jgi:hypothetical protein